MKALAVLLYGMGGMGFSAIGCSLGRQQRGNAEKWMRAGASALPEPTVSSAVVTVEMDEMWRHLKKTAKLWVWRADDLDQWRTMVDRWLPLLHQVQNPANHAAHTAPFSAISR